MNTYSTFIAALVDLTVDFPVFEIEAIDEDKSPSCVTSAEQVEDGDVLVTHVQQARMKQIVADGGSVEWYAVNYMSATVAVVAIIYNDLTDVAFVVGTLTS